MVSCSDFGHALPMLLIWLQWHLSSPCPFWCCITKCGAKTPFYKPPLHLSFFETGEAPQWATHVWLHETRAAPLAHGWRALHDSRQLPRLRQKLRPLKNKCHLKLFPAKGPLGFTAMAILSPLQKKRTKNKRIIFITDPSIRLTRAILSSKTNVPHVLSIISSIGSCHTGSLHLILRTMVHSL